MTSVGWKKTIENQQIGLFGVAQFLKSTLYPVVSTQYFNNLSSVN